MRADRVLQPLRQPDRARVRGGRRRPRGRRGRAGLRLRAWAPSRPSVLALCSSGDHIVAQRQIYAGTSALAAGPVRPDSASTSRVVDGTKPGAFAAAVQPGRTMLVIAETPVEPAPRPRRPRRPRRRHRAVHGRRLDVRHAARPAAARATASTSCCTRPPRASAGHNDATLGVVAGERDLHRRRSGPTPCCTAPCASPFDALNGLRGIRTLAVRQRHQADVGPAARRGAARPPGRRRRPLPRAPVAPAARPGDRAS